MSDSPSDDPHASASADGPGVLAGLPRTRPQRASARRAAARAAGSSATSPRQATERAPAHSRGSGKQREPAARSAAAAERAPRQGFEAEPDSQGPVQPPGGAELVASAAELAGELARAGVTTGARVLRDFLSRLPG